MRDFLTKRYTHLTVTHVVELQNYLQFILVDEGDFEGLSTFCDEIHRNFDGTVELKRESTKSFQLEILVPTSLESKKSFCFDVLPWAIFVGTTLGTCLYAISAISLGTIRPGS